MLDTSEHAGNLIIGYLGQRLSPQETIELKQWIDSSVENRAFFDYIIDPENLKEALQLHGNADLEGVWKLLRQQIPQLPDSYIPPVSRRIYLPYIIRWAAVLLPLAAVLIWVLNPVQKKTRSTEAIPAITVPVTHPKSSPKTSPTLPDLKISLTLHNDSVINLENMDNGFVCYQGTARLVKVGGQLIYRQEQPTASDYLFMNQLKTAKGKSYQVKLSDGTRVWLSSGSSLSFPACFPGSERRITLSGEAYFEVSPKKKKPFLVSAKETISQVFGTSFNIKAYPENPGVTTTVVKGSVQVKSPTGTTMVHSGEQASLTANNDWKLTKIAEPEGVSAWKNGILKFNQASLQEVLPALELWYGFKTEWSSSIRPKKTLTGNLTLRVNITQMARLLEDNFSVVIETDSVHQKIIIYP